MEKITTERQSIQLPAISEEHGDTIFNAVNFRFIYNRVFAVKPSATRGWGKMNIVQMLNHLKVSTASGLNIYTLKDESSFLSRVFIKFIVLRILKRLPKNAPAPEGFKIEMNDTLDFSREKEQVLYILKKAYASTLDHFRHPSFGTMSRPEWGKLVYRHFDHHLRQFSS